MVYAVYNNVTGEILSYGGRPDHDPFVLEDTTGTLAVLEGVDDISHDYYVDVNTKKAVKKGAKPEGVATFNYETKKWDVDTIATVRERRALEYPSIGDQLDALWKLIKANPDKIDLAEAAPLLEAVQAVKDKYPKPPTNDIN